MQVVMRLLKDGSGRLRIHWFVRDDQGPIQTPGGVNMTSMGPVALAGFPHTPGKGARGYIACNKNLKSVSQMTPGRIEPVAHSDDCRAVTCPECMATPEYKAMLEELASIEETAHHGNPNQLKALAQNGAKTGQQWVPSTE